MRTDRIVDIVAFVKRGVRAGETLRWASDRRGRYILHTVIDSRGRRFRWPEVKKTINQVLIKDRGDALRLLMSGRFATRMRGDAERAASLVSPEGLYVELASGTVLPLLDVQPAAELPHP